MPCEHLIPLGLPRTSLYAERCFASKAATGIRKSNYHTAQTRVSVVMLLSSQTT